MSPAAAALLGWPACWVRLSVLQLRRCVQCVLGVSKLSTMPHVLLLAEGRCCVSRRCAL